MDFPSWAWTWDGPTRGWVQIGIFGKKGHKLKYFIKSVTHTPVTLCVIPSGFLNHLAKLTLQNPDFHSKQLDSVWTNHAKSLRKAGLEPSISLLWMNYGNIGMKNGFWQGEWPSYWKKCLFLRHVLVFFLYVHPRGGRRTENLLNLSCLRVILPYHIFINLYELLCEYLATKIGRRILSCNLMYR